MLSNSKKKKASLIAITVLAIAVIVGVVVATTVETSILSVGFTLIKSVASTASDVLSVGFTLIKSVVSVATSGLSVGFGLVKSVVGSATDALSVGFTLIKEGIGAAFAAIAASFHLTPESTPTPTPTPTPPPIGFGVSVLSSCPVCIKQNAHFNATVTGADATPPYTYNWAFGDGNETTGQTVSHVYPAYWRSWDAVVTVTDSVGHIASDTVKCSIQRTKTNKTITNIDDTAYYTLLNALSGQVEGEPINESTVPNFLKFAESITTPYTNIVGNLFFMIFFSAFFLMIWIRQENLAIPSTIGIITGGYILGFAPPEFRLTAVLFISLSIFGIIYMLLKERN